MSITHGLAATPTFNVVSAGGASGYQASVNTKDATVLSVKVTDAAGAALVSTAVTVDWFAGLGF